MSSVILPAEVQTAHAELRALGFTDLPQKVTDVLPVRWPGQETFVFANAAECTFGVCYSPAPDAISGTEQALLDKKGVPRIEQLKLFGGIALLEPEWKFIVPEPGLIVARRDLAGIPARQQLDKLKLTVGMLAIARN